jgi:hypothetical protein
VRKQRFAKQTQWAQLSDFREAKCDRKFTRNSRRKRKSQAKYLAFSPGLNA